MSQWIVKEFERPAAELIDAFRDVPTGILSDCMNRMQALDAGVQALVAGRGVCGPAVTIQAVESCNWGAHQAIQLAQPGDVLVLAARGGTSAAVWGHVMTAAAVSKGLGGVVVDGCIRDAAENRANTLPIYSRGVCPGGPHKGWPCNLNTTVSCAGVPVAPGDLIVGDDDGVVVVPRLRLSEVLAEARQRMATEKSWYERMAAGETTLELLGIKPV